MVKFLLFKTLSKGEGSCPYRALIPTVLKPYSSQSWALQTPAVSAKLLSLPQVLRVPHVTLGDTWGLTHLQPACYTGHP
jgi:hypothetical protein